ncbi:uncharacterized protein V6R79_001900 [Siganus canaliculatus]
MYLPGAAQLQSEGSNPSNKTQTVRGLRHLVLSFRSDPLALNSSRVLNVGRRDVTHPNWPDPSHGSMSPAKPCVTDVVV